MNRKNKKASGGVSTAVIIVVILMAIGAAENWMGLAVVAVIAVIVACSASVRKKKKSEDGTLRRMREHEVSTPAFSARNDAGSAVRCVCAKGKQRYLDQAAMFYKNGLIDRAEYNLMCERYNKLNLPEDM